MSLGSLGRPFGAQAGHLGVKTATCGLRKMTHKHRKETAGLTKVTQGLREAWVPRRSLERYGGASERSIGAPRGFS